MVQKTDELIRIDHDECVFDVHRSVYTDNEIFEQEKNKIFDKCWLYLGHESELPNKGDFKTRRVGGREIVFNRDSENQVRAILNSCRHRGTVVVREKQGNANAFQCFYHAWTYNNKGNLIGIPGREGYRDDFNSENSMGLIQVPCLSNYRGFYFVNFDKNAMELEDYLAGAKEYLDLIVDQSEVGMEIVSGTHEYNTLCNWKMVIENSADPYHAAPTHSTYFDYIAERGGTQKKDTINYDGYNVTKLLGNGHYVIEYDAFKWGRAVARPVEWWPENIKQEVGRIKERLVKRFGEARAKRIAAHDFNMIIFPNLVINNIHSIVIRVIEPVRIDYHDINAWCLLPKDVSQFAKSQALDAFLEFLGPAGLATPDDNEALELAQIGYSNIKEDSWNALSRGMNRDLRGVTEFPMDEEHQLRFWWQKWKDVMAQT